MTTSEFSVALDTLGWSERELAKRLGCDRGLPGKWRIGRARVPAPVSSWLEALADAVQKNPPPEWRTRTAP